MDALAVMDQTFGERFALYNGDAAEALPALPEHSVDLAVFSPPFSSTYTYSPSDRDLGNVRNDAQFFEHYGYVTRALLRIMKPGSIVAVHCANLPTYENRDGASGRKDFRGDLIRHYVAAGFVYHSESAIQKNPQAQAIRTHSKGLLFVQLKRDARWMWQAWADYVVCFRTPGVNPAQVHSDLTQEDWISWAHPVWNGDGSHAAWARASAPPAELRAVWEDIRSTRMTFEEWWQANAPVWTGIQETDVLSVHEARDNDDERHLCPLQLPVIERCVRLWSNPGETVLDPFMGIGSTGVVALQHNRRTIGVELKPSYYRVAARNLHAAEQGSQSSLFSALESEPL